MLHNKNKIVFFYLYNLNYINKKLKKTINIIFIKKQKIKILKKYNFNYNYIKIFKIFLSFLNCNFSLYFFKDNKNDFDCLFFCKFLNLFRFYKIKLNFSYYFLIIYYFFLKNKNTKLLFNFFMDFFKKYSYKNHNSLKNFLTFVFSNTNLQDLAKFNLNGFLFKFKGKFTGKAGDRRRIIYYRVGKHSITDFNSSYEVQRGILNSRTGQTGLTIIFLKK